ncbi:Rubber elongation factor [Dillenia turbinata]|uniref:Rubber elongation factor n=1 Tax=Dillenia turbinata TaxID=194707 RepID=A0AAN8V800_9MAGN
METEAKNRELNLKHLGFVQIVAINTMICVLNLYEYAKQNSGPLRSTVGPVEGAVTAVVGPVYDKLKDVPVSLLVFLDDKVDEASHKFDEHAPPLAKQVVSQAHCAVLKATEVAKTLAQKAQTDGPKAAIHYAAAEYKHFLLNGMVDAWSRLNKIPTIQKAADVAVPSAAHWSEKYNKVVVDMKRKGYPVVGYLPMLPIEKISKAFKAGGEETESEPLSGAPAAE